MHLSSGHLTSKSVTSRGILNYQLLLLWIVFVSWSVGYSLGEPSSPLNCAEVKGDKDWFDCSSEEANLPGWCDNAPLDGENVAGKMQSNLSSVDEPAKGHFDLLFTSSESTSGRYGCESVEATHTAEVAVLGVIMMLILFIIGTMKSTDQGRNSSSQKYPYGNPRCPSRLLLCIAFIICSIAVFSESVDGHEETDSVRKIALLEEKVELNFIAKKSGPFKWYFKPYGSKVAQFINDSSQEDSNVSNPYSILTDEDGYSTLVIDGVILSHAGRYECEDKSRKQKYYVELTVVDPNPVCNPSKEASSIVCRFLYVGNFMPDFDWLTSINTTFCNKSVYDSSTIGLLRIKGYKSPAGLGPCEPKEDEHNIGELSSPLNYAAVNGEIVRLNCSKREDDTGFWFRNTPLSADEILIYHKKIIRNGRFSIDESVPGRSDLLLKASKSTSGRYGCDLVGSTHTAEVIVSAPQPVCLWETKTSFVNASCSISFTGNWPPVIDWYSPKGKVEANSTIIPSKSVTSFVIVPLDDPQEPYFVICSVKFRIEDKPLEATVENIPELFLNICRVEIESGSRPAAKNKSFQKLDDEMTAETSAAASESVEKYWQTESRYSIVLLGDRVEFDCFASSTSPLEWYFKPYGSSESEFINASSQVDSNVTNTNRILKEDSDHATLIIDRVLLTDAGRYECHDTDGQYRLSVEVTVVDPKPVCDESTAPSSIVCRFLYAGNFIPDFAWLKSESTSLCNESAYDSSTIGSLRVKGYKSPAGRWRCKPKEEGPSIGKLSSPLNYAAMGGEKVKLNCSKKEDDTGFWFRNAPLSADKILIYHRRKFNGKWFSTNESDPVRSDLLFTASERTSGRYGCDSVDDTHTAEVIVSDQQPSCSWETQTGAVNASCSIGFSGNWPPVIDWYNPMGKVEASFTSTIPSQRVTSFLTVPLTGDPQELYFVTCSVKFRIEDKPPGTTAENIPEVFRKTCGIEIRASDYGNATDDIDSDGSTESAEHGDAAGAIDLDQAENIDPGPAVGNKDAPKWNDAGDDKPKPSIGSGRESFVLLQLFLAFIAAFVGLGQF